MMPIQGLAFIILLILGSLSKFHKAKGFRFPIGWDTNTMGQILYTYWFTDIIGGMVLVLLSSIISDISATDFDQKAFVGYFISIVFSFTIIPVISTLGLSWGGFTLMLGYNIFSSGLGWVLGGDPFKSTIYIITHIIFSAFIFLRVIPILRVS